LNTGANDFVVTMHGGFVVRVRWGRGGVVRAVPAGTRPRGR
jgi:hypothetical protein